MRGNGPYARGSDRFTLLASVILMAGLSGCASFYVSGDPGHGGVLKRTEHVVAVAAVGLVTSSDNSSVRNAWEDRNGMWHWIRVEPGVGTFRCEGYLVVVPKLCEQISPP